jgi:hypothetical protein
VRNCRCEYRATPLTTSKLHTAYHVKKLIYLPFIFAANELGSAGEPSTVFMQCLSHTLIRTTHKTNCIYRKLLFVSKLSFDCLYLAIFTVPLRLSYYLQNWGNYADMSQGVAICITYAFDVLLICWFGTQLTQHVRNTYCHPQNRVYKMCNSIQQIKQLYINLKTFIPKCFRRRV